MRPALLDPLFADATALPGIGPKLAPLFDRLLGAPGRRARVVDALFHLLQSSSTGGRDRRSDELLQRI